MTAAQPSPSARSTRPSFRALPALRPSPACLDAKRSDAVTSPWWGCPSTRERRSVPVLDSDPRGSGEAPRLLRTYNLALDVSPFASCQVVDAGDLALSPFDIAAAIGEIERGLEELLATCKRVVALEETTRSPFRSCACCTGCAARSQSSTSTRILTPGTHTSGLPTLTARPSVVPPRKDSWQWVTAFISASGARSMTVWTSATTPSSGSSSAPHRVDGRGPS